VVAPDSLNLQICSIHCFISLNFLHFLCINFLAASPTVNVEGSMVSECAAETEAGASGCIDIQC